MVRDFGDGPIEDDDEEGRANARISRIELDERTVVRRSPEVEHERAVAIYDLLEENSFAPAGDEEGGPYELKLRIEENRLLFDISDPERGGNYQIWLAMTPFRRVVRDYFKICESYYDAIKHLNPSQIEAIDMGRRGLHNEGSTLLKDRLAGKVDIDFDTARRLFTLICVLHIRG